MAYSQKAPSVTPESIVRDVKAGNIKPVYYLMGEESYYIDRISEFLVDTLLTEDERAFNLINIFGIDTTIDAVMDTAKGYPMGAQRLVVVVKEAQNLKDIDRLEYYLKQPQPSTVLIFCHKNGKLDRRKSVVAHINKVGVLFESEKLKDFRLPAFINDYLQRKGYSMQMEATAIMVDHIGPDLSRMAGELDKLIISLPKDEKVISRDLVLQNIGMSKEFNIFEFSDAIANKDTAKAYRIAAFFRKNERSNPIQAILPRIFTLFANAMQAYYCPDKSERGVASWLGISDWQVKKNVFPVMQNYSAVKVLNVISEIRKADVRSKGGDGSKISQGDLMKELLYFIFN